MTAIGETVAVDEVLTVGQVAETFGVTVRTLHHYDEIGLLSPSERTHAGYRLYTADDLETAEEILERAVAADAEYSPALSALASIRARRGEYGDALDFIERAVEAGESDADHFKSALEFAPLHSDPRFRTLLSRMSHAGGNGAG